MTSTNKSHFYDLFPMQELSVEQNAVKTCFISTFVMHFALRVQSVCLLQSIMKCFYELKKIFDKIHFDW